MLKVGLWDESLEYFCGTRICNSVRMQHQRPNVSIILIMFDHVPFEGLANAFAHMVADHIQRPGLDF